MHDATKRARFLAQFGLSEADLEEAAKEGSKPRNIALIGVRDLQDVLGLRVWTEAQLVADLDRLKNFIARLVNDPRMRPVFRELARHRTSHPTPMLSTSAGLVPWSFLFVAYWLSCDPTILPTKAEWRGRVKLAIMPRLRRIKRLRAEAVYFRNKHAKKLCDEGQRWAQAMEQAADDQRELMKLAKPPPLLITRIRGVRRRAARTYATLLAQEAWRLYGQHLYGLVATTTTVGLVLPAGEEVSTEEVREWCKPVKRRHWDKRRS